MVEAAWIEAEVLKAVPEAHVEVIDLHGSGDHFHVRVISETFEGVRPLQRQTSHAGCHLAASQEQCPTRR